MALPSLAASNAMTMAFLTRAAPCETAPVSDRSMPILATLSAAFAGSAPATPMAAMAVAVRRVWRLVNMYSSPWYVDGWLRLRRNADVMVLVHHVISGVVHVLPDLEHADRAVLQVAIGIEP